MPAGGAKQRGIASFFGKPGGSKPAPAKAAKDDGAKQPTAAQPSREPATAASTAQNSTAPAAKLRRLKKGTTAANGASEPAAAAPANELDDDINDAAAAPMEAGNGSPAPTAPAAEPAAPLPVTSPEADGQAADDAPTGKRKRSPNADSSPKRQKKSVATAAADDVDAAASGSEPEGDEPSTPPKKPVKKAVLKYGSPQAKVEGVGLGAIAAAAKHEAVDLNKLITWQKGTPIPFSFLAKTWEEIAEESKRLAITQLLANSIRAILASTPEDLLPALYLCTGRVAAAHEGIELGVGDAILIKALAEATGRSVQQIQKEYQKEGDLGIVAASARGKQKPMFKPPPLTVSGVHKIFLEIARTEGQKSQDRKRALINKLLVAASENEAGYIMRCLQGKLRIGLAEQTVMVALAQATLLHHEGLEGGSKLTKGSDLANRLQEASDAVKLAFSQCPSLDVLTPAILEHGPMGLADRVKFVPGVPVKPMLAKPMTGISEILDKFQDKPFTCEYKYDGERAQVHILEDGTVKVYSRNSENNTGKYPDIVAGIPALVKPGVKGLVLDCEAVAYDRTEGKILPFQVLSTRARKDVTVENITIQVCLYAFDCLYKNGEVLIQRTLTERREALHSSIDQKEGHLMLASTKESADVEELTVFLDESVAAGTEGLIVKSLDSTYEPSKRSSHWLKLKKDYMDAVGDTFDVVPIGAWHGKGKRKGVYGAYLLAIYNEEAEEYQTISKIGTGFSEQELIDFHAKLKETVIEEPKSYYRYGSGTPDVWFDAQEVWEVKAADLSVSPAHMAAVDMYAPGKGISIRFPRLVRVRDDKGPEDATSASQVVDMYKAQAIHNAKNGKAAADDDY